MLTDIALGILIGLLFICLIILFCVLIIKLYIHKVKSYTQALCQKDIDFQKTLNTTIIETQEQVLNNISQDLHDDAGQQLTYINFQIENIKLDSPDLMETLTPLSDSVVKLSQSIRRISHSLNNQLLTQQDLVKSIEAEVDRLRQSGKIAVDLILDTNEKFFERNEQIVIYRIFQEILNNILKHSLAELITINITRYPVFVMKIIDNGKGFEYSQGSQNGTIGLNSMSQRAAIIDYSVKIESQPGKGTTVLLSQNSL